MLSFVKHLYYKKKYIIYSLSAIFLFLVCQNSVFALPGDSTPISEVSNYSYNNVAIYDPTQLPNYNNYSYHIYVFNNPDEQIWIFTNSSSVQFRTISPCSGLDFPVPTSSCRNNTGYNRSLTNLGTGVYYPSWSNYSATNISNGSVWFNGAADFVYSDTYINTYQTNYHISNPGFLVNVTPIIREPSISVLLSDLIYDSNDILVHRFLFEVDDYDSSYSYFYRYMSYDGTTYLSNWLDFNVRDLSSSGSTSYVSDYFYNYSNIRIEIKIVSPDNSVVYDNFFVVSDFTYNNYTEYYFNNSNPYYYISGFSGTSMISPFYISRSGSSEIPFMSVYDFTLKSDIPGYWVRSTSCYIDNIFHDNCSYFDISQYSNYDSSHVYGIKINNPYFSTLVPDNTFIFSFAVENSLHVSSSGVYSDGFISEDTITYVDNSGTLITTSGVDSLTSDFTIFNSFFNSSVIHYNSFFIFVSSAFNLFFTTLSSPMVWCWVFCFCMVLIAYCIKFFF